MSYLRRNRVYSNRIEEDQKKDLKGPKPKIEYTELSRPVLHLPPTNKTIVRKGAKR